MLSMPIDSAFSVDEITMLTPRLAKRYAKVSKVTVLRDLKELQELNLIVKDKRKYQAKTGVLKAMMPSKKA
jgi:predicted transcriptional regulator